MHLSFSQAPGVSPLTLVIIAALASWPLGLAAQSTLARSPESASDAAVRLNRIVVTPRGPEDGGDFGPKTPGTRTEGLQEAFNAAKAQGKDLYICGGSFTAGGTPGPVYSMHETLHIPWMQNFHCEAGNCVIQYLGKKGDAVVFDSQMSCYYRFGLIISSSDGAVVRLRPDTAGPDHFKVITTTEFHFNALVGGGGAWPSGDVGNHTGLNPHHPWTGIGLALDAAQGAINCNTISAMEIVGCDQGVLLNGPTTENFLEFPLLHLCNTHLQIGGQGDTVPCNNRIGAFMNSEGIQGSVGARIFGHHNLLTLTAGQMSAGGDVIFEASAQDNLITAPCLPNGMTNRALEPTNRIMTTAPAGYGLPTPPFPRSGEEAVNRNAQPVEVRILTTGKITEWKETDARGNVQTFPFPLQSGQSFTLNPGDRVSFTYDEAATWRWKGL